MSKKRNNKVQFARKFIDHKICSTKLCNMKGILNRIYATVSENVISINNF